MKKSSLPLKHLLSLVLSITFFACNDDGLVPQRETSLRVKIEYATLVDTADYKATFVDALKTSTVDFSDGNNRLKMFQAMNTYIGANITAGTVISAAKLKSMFENSGNSFDDATLNSSGLQLKSVVASSASDTERTAALARMDQLFIELETASKSLSETAEKGKAGKLGTRMLDAKGIELAQIFQKSLIGALEYDYIADVLLTKGLEADNKIVVTGKAYTELEHNWDTAYGLLTFNPVYLKGSTDATRGTSEFGLGAYVWEYNKAAYAKIYPAFLKGRAAIVNNDLAELKTQANFIKAAFEKAIAAAAVGYMGKSNTGKLDSDAHALGEGLGFIYSLRYCGINGGNAAFSDGLLLNLIGSEFGFWDLTPSKTAAASDAIKEKFKL